MPITSTGFYRPGQYNWGGPGRFSDTVVGKDYLNNQAPEAAFTRKLAEMNMGGFDDKSQWARSLYGRAQAGHQAAMGDRPDLTWMDYLKDLDLQRMNAESTAQQKGMNVGGFYGRSRFQPRN